MTESQRAVVGVGSLVAICALVLTISIDVHLRRERDDLRATIARTPAAGTPSQRSSDLYHLDYVSQSVAQRWAAGGYALVGSSIAGVGALAAFLAFALSRRRPAAG